MTDKALQAARRAEHQQRMQVRALREQVFQNQGLEAQDAVFKQLAAAELALRKLEEQRISLENQNGPPGVLLDTQKGEAGLGGIMLGPETTGIDVRVLLRQSHIPTGIVHQLKVDETPLVTFAVVQLDIAQDPVPVGAHFLTALLEDAYHLVELAPENGAHSGARARGTDGRGRGRRSRRGRRPRTG